MQTVSAVVSNTAAQIGAIGACMFTVSFIVPHLNSKFETVPETVRALLGLSVCLSALCAALGAVLQIGLSLQASRIASRRKHVLLWTLYAILSTSSAALITAGSMWLWCEDGMTWESQVAACSVWGVTALAGIITIFARETCLILLFGMPLLTL
jgi:hypothetical protein